MREDWLERVRCWSHVSDLVGDVAAVGLATVVARAESETTPSVGGSGAVDHVVSRSTAVVGSCTVEVVPSVGGHTHSVGGRRAGRRVELERAKVTRDVAWDGELVGLRVTVRERGRSLATTGEGGVDTRFGINTNGCPLVEGAVVHEDDVHAWAVSCANLQVSVAVVVPQVLVELVGTAVHAVVTVGRVHVSTSNPVAVERARTRVETGRGTGATARGVEFEEVFVRVAVVGHLAVHEALRREVAACVDIGGQHGHLLVRRWCVGRVNDVNLVRRRRRLRTRQGWRGTGVGSVAALVQVLVRPVVAEVVTVGKRWRSSLEATVGGGTTTGADGHEFTCIELVVGAQSVRGAAPTGSTVGGVEELRCTA